MKERPILFSAPMVRAILEGRKTQTRRVVKSTMPESKDEFFTWFGGELRSAPNGCAPDGLWARGISGICHVASSPYGIPGDRLWVKETFWKHKQTSFVRHADCASDASWKETGWRKVPSIHMPRWASRLTLEVVAVRVERLQEISEDDAIAEGVQTHAQVYAHEYAKEGIAPPATLHGTVPWYRYDGEPCSAVSARHSFRTLWESINGRGSWDANPWVWVIEFKKAKEAGQ